MKGIVAILALAALALVGVLIALGTAAGAPTRMADTGTTLAVPPPSAPPVTVTNGTTQSSSVSVTSSVSSSCSVSVSTVNGVTTTKSAGCASSNQSCSISVTSINGVTTTTKSPGCDSAGVSISIGDLPVLRQLMQSLRAWFHFGM